MKKTIFITLLCAGLMLVTPFITIAQENKVSNNLPEKPDIEGLVAQIRVVIDKILQKYGHIPIINNVCSVILKLLELIGKIIFCITLLIIEIPLAILFLIFEVLGIYNICELFLGLLILTASTFDSNCPPSTPLNNLLLPFQSLYTLLETKDITNLAKDCPCLQE